MKKKIIIALSGGIDSSIAAFILKKNGFHIEGIYMKNWLYQNTCNSKYNIKYIENICKRLNIKLHILNFSIEYWNIVFKKFLNELKLGKTPNPDIICNKNIKFNILLDYVIKHFNFNFLATGHYAKIEKKNALLKCFDLKKDQTYFLYSLNKKIYKYLIFPLSNYSKYRVKKIIRKVNFINFNKKESMGICFIEQSNYSKFISNFLNKNPGNIVSDKKLILGKHQGLHFYTIGQKIRIKNKNSWYVYNKCLKENTLLVSQFNNKYLFSNKFIISNLYLITKYVKKINCYVKIKHGYKLVLCSIVKKKSKYFITINVKQKALTIGQHSVFFKNNLCIGGGIINKVL